MKARYASKCGLTWGCEVQPGDEVMKHPNDCWGHRDPRDCFAQDAIPRPGSDDHDVRDRKPVLPIAGGSGLLAGATDVRDGLYTVVLDDDSHVTLRFKTQPESAGFAPGEQIVGFLRGSDNESDYTSFAFVKGERLVVWKKFRENHARQQLAASFMLLADDEGKTAAGVRYARESGNCFRCNRTLTDPISVEFGIGPTCRGER